MTAGPGAPGAEGTPAPAGGAPAPGEGRDPAEMLGEVIEGTGEGSEGGESDVVKDAAYWEAEANKWKGLSRKNEGRARDNAAAARELSERKQAEMTEVERANAKATDAETRAAASDQRYFRTMALAQNDLPIELMDNLTGATEEEINASAAALATVLKSRDGQGVGAGQTGVNGGVGPQFRTGRPVEALRPGGAPAGNGHPQDKNDLFRELINRPGQ